VQPGTPRDDEPIDSTKTQRAHKTKAINLYSPCVLPSRTLTSKSCISYIYSTNTGTEYFKHGIYSPFLSLQNSVCFIILTYLVPVLFTFCIQGVLKLTKYSVTVQQHHPTRESSATTQPQHNNHKNSTQETRQKNRTHQHQNTSKYQDIDTQYQDTFRKKKTYTGCPRRNVPDFGRAFLMLKYTDITQNTYIQS